MFHVSADGEKVQFRSRLGKLRTYSHEQWGQIWPRLLDRVLA